MKQFTADQLLIEEQKVRQYLLNTDHPDGGSKARFFIRHGFDPSGWRTFARAIRNHAMLFPVKSEQKTPFGTKYVIEGFLETPKFNKVLIRSVWMIRINEQNPILITVYPI